MALANGPDGPNGPDGQGGAPLYTLRIMQNVADSCVFVNKTPVLQTKMKNS